MGIIVAGFLKLLIPLFSIGTGIAAYYLFAARLPGTVLDQDTAFPMLMRTVVAPVGFGLVGIVAAGLIGAILSSIDSMLNSAATIVTIDFYRRYFRPGASEKELVRVGQACIVAFLAGAALLTIFTMDPNSKDSFFLNIANEQSKLTVGIVVAFGLGMFWKRSTAAAALTAIVAGIVFSYAIPPLYVWFLAPHEPIARVLGSELNFMHRVAAVTVLTVLAHVVVALITQPDAKKSRFTWTDLGGHEPQVLRRTVAALAASITLYAVLGIVLLVGWTTPLAAGLIAAIWTWSLFVVSALAARRRDNRSCAFGSLVTDDRIWAGLLAATAVWMMYYFA
jgi:SSS family solute:Na+ symporter